jgi:hypothetical protein
LRWADAAPPQICDSRPAAALPSASPEDKVVKRRAALNMKRVVLNRHSKKHSKKDIVIRSTAFTLKSTCP